MTRDSSNSKDSEGKNPAPRQGCTPRGDEDGPSSVSIRRSLGHVAHAARALWPREDDSPAGAEPRIVRLAPNFFRIHGDLSVTRAVVHTDPRTPPLTHVLVTTPTDTAISAGSERAVRDDLNQGRRQEARFVQCFL